MIFPGNNYTVTIIWLVSTYVHILYKEIMRNKKKINLSQLVAAMKVRYMKHKVGRRTSLKEIDFTAGHNFEVS